MTNAITRATCVFEPSGKRSAYIVLSILVTIGLCAVAAGILSPAVAKSAQPYAEVSAVRIISTAIHQA
ncbi:hypothetical protein [Brevundimonas sp.]|uniref:hypothetical protein n=1 Tax=Brevundimonas sp. TaxID=1871086 RepID=UPI00289FF091|nr:hypothetical protein [Brevundimonas sp.]